MRASRAQKLLQSRLDNGKTKNMSSYISVVNGKIIIKQKVAR